MIFKHIILIMIISSTILTQASYIKTFCEPSCKSKRLLSENCKFENGKYDLIIPDVLDNTFNLLVKEYNELVKFDHRLNSKLDQEKANQLFVIENMVNSIKDKEDTQYATKAVVFFLFAPATLLMPGSEAVIKIIMDKLVALWVWSTCKDYSKEMIENIDSILIKLFPDKKDLFKQLKDTLDESEHKDKIKNKYKELDDSLKDNIEQVVSSLIIKLGSEILTSIYETIKKVSFLIDFTKEAFKIMEDQNKRYVIMESFKPVEFKNWDYGKICEFHRTAKVKSKEIEIKMSKFKTIVSNAADLAFNMMMHKDEGTLCISLILIQRLMEDYEKGFGSIIDDYYYKMRDVFCSVDSNPNLVVNLYESVKGFSPSTVNYMYQNGIDTSYDKKEFGNMKTTFKVLCDNDYIEQKYKDLLKIVEEGFKEELS